MISNIAKRLSAKKPAKRNKTDQTVQLDGGNTYEELLEKYNTNSGEIQAWMKRTAELVAEIENINDITPGTLGEHLASANGYGLNYTSSIFLMIHAAITENKYLIPMADIPEKLSEDERQRLSQTELTTTPNMNQRLRLSTNRTFSLRVDRDNWYDKPAAMTIDTEDMIKFMMLSRQIQHLEPLRNLARIITDLPFKSCTKSNHVPNQLMSGKQKWGLIFFQGLISQSHLFRHYTTMKYTHHMANWLQLFYRTMSQHCEKGITDTSTGT